MHSLEVGLILHLNQTIGQGQCGLLKNNLFHHNWYIGLFADGAFSKIVAQNNVFVDNVRAIYLQLKN